MERKSSARRGRGGSSTPTRSRAAGGGRGKDKVDVVVVKEKTEAEIRQAQDDRLLLGSDLLADWLQLWERALAGEVLEGWRGGLVETASGAIVEGVIGVLKEDSKCRLQCGFSRPPKETEITLHSVALMTKINAEVPAKLLAPIEPIVRSSLVVIQSQIESVLEILRGSAEHADAVKADCQRALDNLAFDRVEEQGEVLDRLEKLVEAKLPMFDLLEETKKARKELLIYFGFPATDIEFSFHGTSRVPLTDVRPTVLEELIRLDADLRKRVVEWESQVGIPLDVDGSKVLDSEEHFGEAKRCIEEVRSGVGESVVVEEGKGKKKKVPGKEKPAPKKKKIPEGLVLPPGLVFETGTVFRSVHDLPEDETVHLDEPFEAQQHPVKPLPPRGEGALFRVVVRLRPLIQREIDNGDTVAVKPTDDGRTVHFTKSALALGTVSLSFDRCVAEAVTQDSFFLSTGVLAMIDGALDGSNVTIMAYGQTGSGKTFTMSGPEEYLGANSADKIVDPVPPVIEEACRSVCQEQEQNQGLIPRVIKALFQKIRLMESRRRDEDFVVEISASYIEIYNEKVQDLLSPREAGLPVRQGEKGFFVGDVAKPEALRSRDLLRLFVLGSFNRRVANTRMNSESSRSHSVFTIYLTFTYEKAHIGTVKETSKIVLVDLAGSERLKQIGGSRDHEETSNINKSLFALSNVIARLGQGQKEHVPYRDSNLTKLLMDSLGGSGKSLLIACLSPSGRYVDESVNTLSFASKAGNIQQQNVELLSEHEIELRRLHEIIEKLESEKFSWKERAERYRELLFRNDIELPKEQPIGDEEESKKGFLKLQTPSK